jgi:hypothetical protein
LKFRKVRHWSIKSGLTPRQSGIHQKAELAAPKAVDSGKTWKYAV